MRGYRNSIEISLTQITVRPRGLDFIWCFRRELVFSLDAVKSVQVIEKSQIKRGLRTLGTDFGFKICGTFQSKEETNFWNYRSPGPVLVIQMMPGQQFSNLLLTVALPKNICEQIAQKLRQ